MAILARRLEDAASAGCDIAVVTTQPGSKSQQNVQFEPTSVPRCAPIERGPKLARKLPHPG
jgi:hypothetical protein